MTETTENAGLPTIAARPGHPDQVVLTIPDFHCLDTQAGTWSVDIAIDRGTLPALRAAINEVHPPADRITGVPDHHILNGELLWCRHRDEEEKGHAQVVTPGGGSGPAPTPGRPERAGEDGELVHHIAWYCWRCRDLVEQPCRSDNVPIYVAPEWVADLERELAERDAAHDRDPLVRVSKALQELSKQAGRHVRSSDRERAGGEATLKATAAIWAALYPERDPEHIQYNVMLAPVDDPPVCERRGCGHLVGLHQYDPDTRQHSGCTTGCGCTSPLDPWSRT